MCATMEFGYFNEVATTMNSSAGTFITRTAINITYRALPGSNIDTKLCLCLRADIGRTLQN